jgi:hypothetical protein
MVEEEGEEPLVDSLDVEDGSRVDVRGGVVGRVEDGGDTTIDEVFAFVMRDEGTLIPDGVDGSDEDDEVDSE